MFSRHTFTTYTQDLYVFFRTYVPDISSSISRHTCQTYLQDILCLWSGHICQTYLHDIYHLVSRHTCKTYRTRNIVLYVLMICVECFTTYPQDICVLQDISVSFICLEGMCWDISRHILKTYVFFKTYLPDISSLYVLKICVDISQDISSRHMNSQDIPSTHIFLNAHSHDIPARHNIFICLEGMCWNISRHIFKTYDFSRHTVNTYIS